MITIFNYIRKYKNRVFLPKKRNFFILPDSEKIKYNYKRMKK